jgi:hypothetical protein
LTAGEPTEATPGSGGADVELRCDEQPDACGKQAFDAGVQAFQAGDFKSALALFQKAYGFKKHPAVALNLALAEAKNGMFLEAASRLADIENDSQASDELKRSAQSEREQTERSIALITLDIAGPGAVTAEVDGATMSGSPPSSRLNPGRHVLKVADRGKVLVDRAIDLQPGEHLRIAVERAGEVKVVVPPDKVIKHEASRGLDPTWFYASAGVTIALGAVTVWSGLDADNAYDSYQRDLPKLDQDEINRRVDDGNGKETRTNVLLAVTSLAAVGTTALGVFAIDWGSDNRQERGTVAVTPRGLAIHGRF